jgi:hypothetical protein
MGSVRPADLHVPDWQVRPPQQRDPRARQDPPELTQLGVRGAVGTVVLVGGAVGPVDRGAVGGAVGLPDLGAVGGALGGRVGGAVGLPVRSTNWAAMSVSCWATAA